GVSLGLRVDCAAVGPQLHVCVEGNALSGTLVQPAVWRSIRAPSGSWSQGSEVTGRFNVIREIACASITPTGTGARPQLEILTRPDSSGSALEPLVHTTLLPTGGSSGDVNISSGAPTPPIRTTTNFSLVRTMATAGVGMVFHIVLAANAELFH